MASFLPGCSLNNGLNSCCACFATLGDPEDFWMCENTDVWQDAGREALAISQQV